VSELCDELRLHPTQFYRWQKQFFEAGAAAFDTDHSQQLKAAEKHIAALETKLQGKNEVLSELLEEHVQLKKRLGET
jgi:transposase-like protein